MTDPRPWVPGVAYASDAGDLHVGPSSGFRSRDPSFAGLRCGHGGGITEWTHTAWVAPRVDLNPDVVATHGVVLPESLVDPQTQPHTHRWLREQPLVAVSGATWIRLVEDGVRLCRVSFDAPGDRRIRIDVIWTSDVSSAAVIADDDLQAAAALGSRERPLFDVHGDPSTADRLLRSLSNDLVDEESLLNAVDVRRLVEDGYGYRGASDGWFRGIEDLENDLAPLNTLFGQVFERGDAMRTSVESLVAAIDAHAEGTSEVSVDGVRVARAIAVPALRLPRVERLTIAGDERVELVLPAQRRWSLGKTDHWSPDLP